MLKQFQLFNNMYIINTKETQYINLNSIYILTINI